MIVLHANWDNLVPGKLHLWAESSSPTGASVRRRGKQTEEQQTQQHPFALPHDPLQEAISELVGSLLSKSVGSSRLRLSLPSTATGPLSSPELMLEKEPIDLKVTGFKSWEVATLTLEPGNALDFLLALPNDAPRGIAFGSSLRFWMEAARFTSN